MDVLENKVSVLFGLLLVLIGMFIYNILLIRANKKVNKFSDIKVSIWWAENQIRFIMTFIIIMVVFYMSWHYDELTADHCLLLGTVGNLVLEKFMKIMGIGEVQSE